MNTQQPRKNSQSPPTYDEADNRAAVTMNKPTNNRVDLTEQSQEERSGYTSSPEMPNRAAYVVPGSIQPVYNAQKGAKQNTRHFCSPRAYAPLSDTGVQMMTQKSKNLVILSIKFYLFSRFLINLMVVNKSVVWVEKA